MEKKALLVVSFGTSYPETRKRTIDAMEKALADAFPDRTFYRAWTSRMIRNKLLRTTGEVIPSVEEALAAMAGDGVTDVLVQTTHMLPGEETDVLREALRAGRARFAALAMGAPLLASPEDVDALAFGDHPGAVCAALADVIEGLCPAVEGELLCLMGHGSARIEDNVYRQLDERFRRHGREDICVGTVEFTPGFEPVLARIRERRPALVRLAPLMVVAGDHACNDMAGDEPDSWKSRIRAEGFPVECVLRGMGEYEAIRERYIRHAKDAAAL